MPGALLRTEECSPQDVKRMAVDVDLHNDALSMPILPEITDLIRQ